MTEHQVSLVNSEDGLYDDACRIATAAGYVSVGLLSMRLRIGYMRATAIIDEMEKRDFCYPYDDAKGGARRRLIKVQ